jgi:hypothetical protein
MSTPIAGPATLMQWTQGQDETTVAIARLFALGSPLAAAMNFENVAGGGYRYSIRNSAPGIAFRGINETYTPSIGVMNPQFEPLFVAGGHFDVDTALIAMYGRGRKAREVAAQVRSAALFWTKTFFTGDSSTNPRVPDGMMVRLRGNQILDAGTTAGGAALSLLKLDEGISRVFDPTHLAMPTKLKLRFTEAGRDKDVGGLLGQGKNEFGQPYLTYNGLPIIDLGQDETGTDILGFNEAASSGANTATSIYVLSLRPGHVSGIQNAPMRATDLGELQSEPKERVRLEWLNGWYIEEARSVCRIRYIGDLKFTA